MLDMIKLITDCPKLISYFMTTDKLCWKEDKRRLAKDRELIHSTILRTSDYANFTFRYNHLEIEILPHYCFNNHQHNANDFTVTNCIELLNNFVTEFELQLYLNKFKVVNIEYGINIISPICSKNLVNCISYHQKNEFVNDDSLKYSKKSFSVNEHGKMNKYKFIKAYSKGVQFPQFCDINTFRFEIKSKQSKFIKTLGIEFLIDLLEPSIYQNLKNSILKEWDEVLILYSKNTLAPKHQKYLTNQFWYEQKQKSRNRFSYSKKEFNKILNISGHNIHQEMKVTLANKLNSL